MSDHYEVVLGCFLSGDTPADLLDAIRYHLGLADSCPPRYLESFNAEMPVFVVGDPESRLPGGDHAVLRWQETGRDPASGAVCGAWGLFVRAFFLDDDMGLLYTFGEWLAPWVEEPGFLGTVREVYDIDVEVLHVDGGRVLRRR